MFGNSSRIAKKLVRLSLRLCQKIKSLILSLLPVGYRLQKGLNISVRERNNLVKKLQVQKKDLQSFPGKRVLLWEPAPFPVHIAIGSSIGVALSLRGCKVEQVICDGLRIACIGREITDNDSFSNWKNRCVSCFKICRNEAISFGIKTYGLGELVSTEKIDELRKLSKEINVNEIDSFTYKNINVGLYASSSLRRYYKGKIIEPEEDLLREFFFSALLITESAIEKVSLFDPDAIYMSHGIYADYGPVLRLAVEKGIPVIKMGGGYLPSFTYFRKIKNGNNVHQGILSEQGWLIRRGKSLTPEEKNILDLYIKKRYMKGYSSDISLSSNPINNHELVLKQLEIDHSKPIWCVFTNVSWDASIDVAPMSFDTPEEWLIETIRTISNIRNIQWLVKIHPSEKTSGTVHGAIDKIKYYFPDLPPNVKIIPPDTELNTYDILKLIDGGITCFGNTSGLELLMLGKPMIVAGESIYAKCGFTYDGLTPEKYISYLKMVPNIPPLNMDQQDDANKLAYSFFIQRQMPLRMFKTNENGRFSSFDWREIESLLPGRDPVIDMICERFFVGEDFILDDEIIHDVVKL